MPRMGHPGFALIDDDGTILGWKDQASGKETRHPSVVTDPVTGGISLNAASKLFPLGQSGTPYTDLFAPGNGVTPIASVGAGASLGSSGFVTVDGEQWFKVTATGTAGSNNYFEIAIPTFNPASADTAIVEYMTDGSLGSPMTVYLGTAAYAIFATATRPLSASNSSDPFQNSGYRAATIHKSLWTKNSYTRDTIEQLWTVGKLRVTVTNGSTRDFYLRSFRIGVSSRKGRLCVIADDGYDSFYKSGVPILDRFGIKSTMAIIADKIGAANYVTASQLQQYVGSGNYVVAHGPIGGSGNLWTTYTTNAERIADINYHRDTLIAAGLMPDPRSKKCYVFPQGVYNDGTGEVSLLNDMRDEGYELCRSAGAYPNKSGSLAMHVFGLRNVSTGSHSRMCLPIIGHDYNGASNTADDANETTNVNRIITTIQDVADCGLDAFLMLHKVVARGAATSGGIEIESDRLNAIAAAIQTQVAAGKLETVGMPEFI